MTKNLIAIDMDGTLLNEEQQISTENIRAIKERAEHDLVYICSGRDFFDIQKILKKSGLQVPIASLNAAFIMNGEEKIFSRPFDKKDILAMFSFIEPFPFKMFTNKGTYNAPAMIDRLQYFFQEYGEEDKRVNEQSILEYLIRYEKSTTTNEFTSELFEDEELEIYKISVYLPESDIRLKLYKEIKECTQLPITSSGLCDYELLPEGVDKGKSFGLLQEYFKLGAVRKIAIGDSPNDLPMIEASDISFAVENAGKEIQSLCTHVVPSNDDHGVAYVLNSLDSF